MNAVGIIYPLSAYGVQDHGTWGMGMLEASVQSGQLAAILLMAVALGLTHFRLESELE